MDAKEFYISREIEKNPQLEEMIKDHAEEMDEIFHLMEEYADHKKSEKEQN